MNKHIILLFIILCIGLTRASAQHSITGKVLDATNQEPIPFASVTIKNVKSGTTTDNNGNFTLKVNNNDILIVSFMGYETKEVNIGTQKKVTILLSESSVLLDAVVVTGFQNLKKTTFTGSSVKIKADDINLPGETDISRMLEGKAAGVSIQNVSSTFGSAPKIRVRGATSINGENKPLWVVDGIVLEDVVNVSNDQLASGDPTTLLGSSVAGINTNDIETIDVLKDAAATALYGARAMNGVVVITTKRGKEGKPRIHYSGNYTVRTKPRYSEFNIMNSAEKWLTPAYDAETQAEVKRMLENDDKTELIEAFYKDLEFGTGGLRGIMGVGSNRMNIYTVGAATQGLSNYLKKNFKDLPQISVVVGHDCRNNSRLFAETSANIFSANGIKVYLFDDMRPTPEMSFAIRHLGCQSGIILTASHNPKEYNGYKAYWDDGAQVLAPHDKGIIDEVNAIASAADIKFQGNPDLIQIIGEDIDKIYLDMVKTVSIDPAAIARHKDMKIVYTPIHGTGMMLIPRALKMWGFENVFTVPEQMIKDGNFPTVVSPNPENAEALSMAVNLAKEIDADLVMASDPDADRVGIACKDDKGEWVLINGNQTCMMYLYYILTQYKQLGKIKGGEFCVKTIVTTELIKKIADKNNIEMLDCYTGFKWIAREIRLREGKQKYIGGGEESYGFLAEDFVRDKDAVSACCLIAEVAAWAKDNGKSLYQLLLDIYVEYGFSKEFTVNVVKPGKSGAEEIKAMMENFRANPPKELGGSKVILSKDYKTLKQTDDKGNVTAIDMPEPSNVLQYFTEDGSKVSVRPSGTEPKIKFYMEVQGEMGCRNCYASAESAAMEKIEAVKKSLGI